MKWALRNETAEKRAENGDFQVVGSLLYAHYPIYFFLLFEQYYQVLCCVKIPLKKKFESTNMGFAHFKILIFSDFSSMGVGLEKES